MKKLQTLSAQILAAEPFEPGRFGVMAGDFLTEYRLRHLIEDTLPSFTSVRPQFSNNGELEAILLNPLYLLATKILNGSAKPGFVTNHFLRLARRFALVAEHSNLQAFRTQQLMSGDMFITSSHLAQFFSEEPEAGDEGKLVTPSKQAQLVLSFLLGWETDRDNPPKKIDDEWVASFIASSPKSVVDPEKITDAFTATQQLLFTYGGKGRGGSISMESHQMMLNSFQTIEAAIAACLKPDLAAKSKIDSNDMLSDGYALAMAYIVYLSHSSSPDAYDAIFPPSVRSASAQTSNVLMGNSARRAAWFFAGLSSAPAIFDLVAMTYFVRNSIDFLTPLLDTEISEYKDMMVDLSAAEAVLKDNTVSPVQHHCTQILSRITKVAAVDSVLPYFVGHLLKLPVPEFRKDENIPKGYMGISKGFITRQSVTSTDMAMLFPHLTEVVGFIRRVGEEIAYTMSSFHLSSEYDPNSFNVQSSLFDLHDDPTPATEIRYASPIHRDVIPLSIPRYVVEDMSKPARDRKWILDPYTYGVIDIIALRKKLKADEPRFVFDRKITLPVKHSIAARFSRLPIPLLYTSTTHFPNVGNTISDITLTLTGNTAITAPSAYFEDAAAVMFSSDHILKAVTRALAGICRVYVAPITDGDQPDWSKVEGGNYKYLRIPALPFVYGMPTKALWECQPSITDIKKSNPDQIKVVTVPEIGVVAFVLHSTLPMPQACFGVNAQLEDGFIATIPCGIDWYTKMKSIIWANADKDFMIKHKLVDKLLVSPDGKTFDKVAEFNSVVAALADVPFDWIKKLKEYKRMLGTVTGWSHLTQYYPHLFFSVENPGWGVDSVIYDLDTMNHVSFRRRLITGSRSLYITGAVEDYIAVIEPSDLTEMSRAEDASVAQIELVSLSPEKSEKAKPAPSPSDPTVTTVSEGHPERLSPLEEHISSDEARHVVTSASLRGTGTEDISITQDMPSDPSDPLKRPDSGTLAGEPSDPKKKRPS